MARTAEQIDRMMESLSAHFSANPEDASRMVLTAMMFGFGRLDTGKEADLFARVYCACDGFGGGMTTEWANRECFDRSHVRDSSDDGFIRAALVLAREQSLRGVAVCR